MFREGLAGQPIETARRVKATDRKPKVSAGEMKKKNTSITVKFLTEVIMTDLQFVYPSEGKYRIDVTMDYMCKRVWEKRLIP